MADVAGGVPGDPVVVGAGRERGVGVAEPGRRAIRLAAVGVKPAAVRVEV